MGKTVLVYYTPKETRDVEEGVTYRHYTEFDVAQRFKTLILWRLYGTAPVVNTPLHAERILIDMHDNLPAHYLAIKKTLTVQECPVTLMLKSRYHKEQYLETVGNDDADTRIIMNGVNMSVFQTEQLEPRNPYRLCYCSDYRRGLVHILELLWPYIVQLEPRAELHLYYGIKDQEYKPLFDKALLSSTGVCDHGRQSLEMIAREKHISNFNLYITNTIAEIDCISVRESLVAGCIPLLLDYGVFRERDGIHFSTSARVAEIATKIVELMRNMAACDAYREKLKQSPTIVSWTEVAQKWLEKN